MKNAARSSTLLDAGRSARVRQILLAVLAAAGLVASVGLVAPVTDQGMLHAAGGTAVLLGRVAGLAGTYLMMITLVLIGRVPFVERVFGQDRLLKAHRWLGPAVLILLGTHVLALVVGYAQQTGNGLPHQLWVLIVSYPGMLMAATGFALLVAAAVVSYRAVRRRLKYETWWAIHLYMYIGAALAFTHQLSNGAPFIDHPVARWFWIALWAATAGLVIVNRWVVPLVRSAYHDLRVAAVVEEAPGVVSVVMHGRHLKRLSARGGQFMLWRFLSPGLWWQAHPYSLSALPSDDTVRITVKQLGDHSGSLASLEVGTRVAIEGPYGAFTGNARKTDRVLLVAAGVGVTPVRTLLEDLPAHVDVVAILRSVQGSDLALRDEVEALVSDRGGSLHEVIGAHPHVALDGRRLRELVPDIAQRDLYMCGPPGFMRSLRAAARSLGVPGSRIHYEKFAF
ncbi:MAG: ferredoxin reductase family protein [Thermoleophilia bacterium]